MYRRRLKKDSLTFHGTSANSWTPKKSIVYKKFVFLSHFSWQFKGQLSGKFFISSLVQREKSYSCTPEILIVYKELIYPFTYTREFTRQPTTTFSKISSLVQGEILNGWAEKHLALYLYKGKIGHLYAQENKKRPTHPRTTKRGVQSASRSVRIVHVCISLWIAPFVFQFLSHGFVGALS